MDYAFAPGTTRQDGHARRPQRRSNTTLIDKPQVKHVATFIHRDPETHLAPARATRQRDKLCNSKPVMPTRENENAL